MRLFMTLLLWGAVLTSAQSSDTPVPQQPPAKPQFFAGTVTALDNQHVTISRALVGHAPETRTFLIDAKTKLSKSALKIKAKATVRYQHLSEGDLALEIQIHAPPRSSRPS